MPNHLFPHQAPLILAIDTSCDDTAAAVVRGQVILSNIVASQAQLHKPYGGVYPTIAKQAHKENWPATVRLALQRAGVKWNEIAAIAVTVGPGLAPALEVGVEAAQTLAAEHHLPLVAVNHIEAHAWSSQAVGASKVGKNTANKTPAWPVLAVIVSGGHTQFVAITEFGQYQILGQTLDDAAGECLDKVGRMLSLGYPAGPVVEEFARLGRADRFAFPLPMTTTASFDLSYSGIKTHARNLIEKLDQAGELNQQTTYDVCAGLQQAVFGHLSYKLQKLLVARQGQADDSGSADDQNPADSGTAFQAVWLGGGVAANMMLRKTLRATLQPFGLKLAVPYSKRLCGDNAAMIGLVGALKFNRGLVVLEADQAKLERQPRLQLQLGNQSKS